MTTCLPLPNRFRYKPATKKRVDGGFPILSSTTFDPICTERATAWPQILVKYGRIKSLLSQQTG